MKKVNLTVGERVYMVNLLNDYKGNLEGLAAALEDIKKIVLTEDERTEVDYKIITNNNGTTSVTWDPKKAQEKEMELSEFVVTHVADTLKKKDEKGEFTLADVGIMELKKKLEDL